jgi:cytochrome c-type biogenesis protein CcmF
MPIFEGEHLIYGQLGHFFVILALISAVMASIGFGQSFRHKELHDQQSWLRFSRISFSVHTLSIVGIFSVLFYICANHLYEYMYAYKHASKELEPRFLLACIWEGQEGSFLLWGIWHAVLGSWLMRKKIEATNTWEAPVMMIVSITQVCLMGMILGIYIADIRIGNSPFTLTRNEIQAPIFAQANYLSFIKDGMGLNVLLRNYWMVIHPPVLFLGFASLLIPFAYAVASLLRRNYTEWVKPAMPWVLFGMTVLGIGIMMGGKWAYESLSFGGYWAWDPVENASLVPWLLLVAGLHTLLIYRATGHSLRASYVFVLLSFLFVLYSTFLTRTGILGDTSVHAFTEAGKTINLMIGGWVLLNFLGSMGLLTKHYKHIPAKHQEEEGSSREFWMFIGSLVFFLSGIFIILITSIPVYGKTPLLGKWIDWMHDGPLAMPEDPEFLYNKVMVLVAVVIGMLMAITQYLRYKSTPRSIWLPKLALPTLTAAVVTGILAVVYPFTYDRQGAGFLIAIYLAFFAMVYAFTANIMYLFTGLNRNWKKAGSVISHAGFALMIAGMLVSSSNKRVISDSNVNGIQVPIDNGSTGKQKESPRENLTLIRSVPATMGDYKVTYTGDSAGLEKGRKFYQLQFFPKSTEDKNPSPAFALQPDVYVMKDNNMSSNPDTKSFLDKDVFTYLSYAVDPAKNQDTASFRYVELGEGDTAYYSNGFIRLNRVVKNPTNEKYKFSDKDLALMADLTLISKDSQTFQASPLIRVDSMGIVQIDDTVYAQNLYVQFGGVTDNQRIRLGIKEASTFIDFITVKTYEFPWIVLVWLGLVIMAIGISISFMHRMNWSTGLRIVVLGLEALALLYLFLLAN